MIHSSQKNLISICLIGIFVALLASWPFSISADGRAISVTSDARTSSVNVTYFGAVGRQDGISISWETANEMNVLGFYVYRGTTEQRDGAAQLNAALIPAQGVGGSGGRYSLNDQENAEKTTYYFWLGVVSFTGRQIYYGPATAQRLAAGNNAPQAMSISPQGASCAPNVPVYFAATYADADGYEDLRFADLLISDSADQQTRRLYVRYDRQAGRAYLRNDDNSAWLSGVDAQSPISNTYAILYPANTEITAQENTLTVRWAVLFKSTMSPRFYQQFLRAEDSSGVSSGWQHPGNWTVNTPPTAWKLSPSNIKGSTAAFRSFKAYYRDGDGYNHLSGLELFIGASPSNLAQGIRLRYDQNSNRVYLWNEATRTWVGGYVAGTPGQQIETALAVVNVEGTRAGATSRIALQVNWSIRFKTAFVGSHGVFLRCEDDLGGGTAWKRTGKLTVRQ